MYSSIGGFPNHQPTLLPRQPNPAARNRPHGMPPPRHMDAIKIFFFVGGRWHRRDGTRRSSVGSLATPLCPHQDHAAVGRHEADRRRGHLRDGRLPPPPPAHRHPSQGPPCQCPPKCLGASDGWPFATHFNIFIDVFCKRQRTKNNTSNCFLSFL